MAVYDPADLPAKSACSGHRNARAPKSITPWRPNVKRANGLVSPARVLLPQTCSWKEELAFFKTRRHFHLWAMLRLVLTNCLNPVPFLFAIAGTADSRCLLASSPRRLITRLAGCLKAGGRLQGCRQVLSASQAPDMLDHHNDRSETRAAAKRMLDTVSAVARSHYPPRRLQRSARAISPHCCAVATLFNASQVNQRS